MAPGDTDGDINIDDEFAALTAGLDAGSIAAQEGPDDAAPTPKQAPEPAEQTLCTALVLVPFDSVAALLPVLKLAKAEATVVDLEPGLAVWLRLKGKSSVEDEASAFLTGTRPVPAEVDTIARVTSGVTRYGSVAVVSWLSDEQADEPGVSGVVTAKRYVGGEPDEDLVAGLLLNSLSDRAEDLLLGRAVPEDLA